MNRIPDACITQGVEHDSLAPLFAPLNTLRGVGPAVATLLARVANGERVLDLLFHLPEFVLGPAIASGHSGRAAGTDRHAPGGGGPPRPPGQSPPTVARGCARRHRHRRTGLLPLPARSPNATGREAAGLRQARPVQRPADHASSGPCGSGRSSGTHAGDRAGLADDRRPVSAPDRRRHGRRVGGDCRSCRSGTMQL